MKQKNQQYQLLRKQLDEKKKELDEANIREVQVFNWNEEAEEMAKQRLKESQILVTKAWK